MEEINPVDSWLNMVSDSNSGSKMTRQAYKVSFQLFCEFIEKTGKQIFNEYEQLIKAALPDIAFKRKYAQLIKAWTEDLEKKELSPNSKGTRVGAVKSFFKYNDLPLAFIPKIKLRVLYHNRDITREEIKLILRTSKPRERAIYAIMAQSGLRPNTICNLKYENIKEDYENKQIPCKIEIPQEITKGKNKLYFTFIGQEAVKHLRSYLIVRPKIKDEEYLFLKEGTKQRANPKSISALFGRTVKNLKEKGKMKLKQEKENKPHDIRLYSLRKWFRKYANQAGFENVHFWMGHTVKAGQEEHYRPKDVEYYRKKYAENAMPFLRFETTTSTETEKTFTTLKQENKALKEKIENLETQMEKIYKEVFREKIEDEEYQELLEINPEYVGLCERNMDEQMAMDRDREEGYGIDPPKAREMEDEEWQYFMNHPEAIEKYIEEKITRMDERRKTLRDLQDTITKAKKNKK